MRILCANSRKVHRSCISRGYSCAVHTLPMRHFGRDALHHHSICFSGGFSAAPLAQVSRIPYGVFSMIISAASFECAVSFAASLRWCSVSQLGLCLLSSSLLQLGLCPLNSLQFNSFFLLWNLYIPKSGFMQIFGIVLLNFRFAMH